MIRRIEADALTRLIDRDDTTSAVAALAAQHPTDIAATVVEMPPDTAARVLGLLPVKRQGQVFGYLEPTEQFRIARAMSRADLGSLFAAMEPDERADLYKRLPEDVREAILPGLAAAEREDIRKLASYPENTVGAVMTSAYATLPPALSAREAIEQLRREAPDRETIYDSYVIDEARRLIGVVSLRDLLLAPPDRRVSDIMRRDVVKVSADAPRGEVVRLIREYDLIALPVINGGEKLVGLVTADDAMDIAEREEGRRIQAFGGTGMLGGPDLDLLNSSLWSIFKARYFWLALLTVFGLFTSHLVADQQELLEKAIILAVFIAPIIDMGGNTGSQTATMVIRAMALGQVRLRLADFWLVFRRDLPIAAALGVGVAVLEAVLAYTTKNIGWEIVAIVGLSMLACTVVGSLVGLTLPFAARAMKQDPATLSSPVITSVMDMVGVLIYFGIAVFFLGRMLGIE